MKKLVLSAILVAQALLPAVRAVDGIAISTHRENKSEDAGPGVHPSMFGNIVRHTVKDGKVVESKVLYQGKARCGVINQTGTKVAFVKLDGRIHVMDMDGGGLKELEKAQNRNASWLAWPAGDWIYYSQEGKWPTGDWFRGKSMAPDTCVVRRINAVSGEEEEIGRVKEGIWQLSMAANAQKGAGRFTIVGWIMDLADTETSLNKKELACGTGVSCDGKYVTEVLPTHADIRIYRWPLDQLMDVISVNAYTDKSDGRVSMYRPRWSVNSNAWLVVTQGADFGCTQKTNMVLYNWKEKKQIQITNNPLDSEASDEGDAFWLAGVANDLAGSGLTEGEVPLTVELGQGLLEGDWAWDFGDGSRGTGPIGKHTYEKPGSYTVSAVQGARTLRQTVVALERKPLSLVRADILDDRRIALSFDKPVSFGKDAVVRLEGGAAASVLKPLEASSRLLAEWSEPLPRKGRLHLSGIQDTVQVPNGLQSPEASYEAPSWPVKRDNLVFVWGTRNEANMIYDSEGKRDRSCSVWVWDGLSKFTRDGAMEMGPQGNFTAGRGFLAGLNFQSYKNAGSTFEALVHPENLEQNQIIVGSGGYGGGNPRTLEQRGKDLYFRLLVEDKDAPREPTKIATLESAKPVHVAVTYSPGKLVTYLDGVKVSETDYFKGLPAKNHNGGHLSFGSSSDKAQKSAWKGVLQNVAFYGRELDSAEVAQNHAVLQQILSGRKVVASCDVKAELAASSAVESVADIAPYDNALIVNEYKVLESSNPALISVGQPLRVAQWGVQQKKVLPVNSLKAGDKVSLKVEKLSDNPQLESIFLRDKLPENFGAEVYFDVSK